MSGLLNELESYDEVQRAIATQGASLRVKEARIQFLEDEGLTRSDSQGVVMAEEMRERKRAKLQERLNDCIVAKKAELAPYDRAGITSKYTDDKASRLRKELKALRVRLGKACKVPPLRRK